MNCRIIQSIALQSALLTFKCSDGFISRFLKRNKLVRRKKTHVIQKWVSSTVEDIGKYFNTLYTLSDSDKDKKITYINIDEVPIYFDMSPDYTYHFKGAKEVSLLSHSKNKVRMSLLMAISSDGIILSPMMLFVYKYAGKKTRDYPKKFEKFRNVTKPWMLKFNESGFTTSSLIIEYIQKIISKQDTPGKKVLIMDTASSHIHKEVKNELSSLNIDTVYIPGGCTSILQPLDVVINKPLKDKIRNQYLEWLEKAIKNKPNSAITPPDIEDVIKWCEVGIASLSKELVKKSFDTTGITKTSQLLADNNFLHAKLREVMNKYFEANQEDNNKKNDSNDEEDDSKNETSDTDSENEYDDGGDTILREIANDQEIFFEDEQPKYL